MPKLGTFPCPKCDRKFRMAAHLARHLKYSHDGSGSADRAAEAVRIGDDNERTADIASREAFEALLRARDQVATEQARLASQLEAIERALAAFGESIGAERHATTSERRPGRRAKRGTVTLSILRMLGEKGPIKPAGLAAAADLNPNTVSTSLDAFRRKRLAVRSDAGWSLSPSGKAELARRQAVR